MRTRDWWISHGAQCLLIGVAMSAAFLAWLGYQAIVRWQNAATTLEERRTATQLDISFAAVMRNMRAVQAEIATWRGTDVDQTRDLVAGLFARYSYPDWCFMWPGDGGSDSVVFFARPDRIPARLALDESPTQFTVLTGHALGTANLLLSRLAQPATQREFVMFALDLGGGAYQVVARLLHEDPFGDDIQVAYGFAVNALWVRQHYMPELLPQIARLGSGDPGLVATIFDSKSRVVAGARSSTPPVSRRSFPLVFFDPLMIAVDLPADLTREFWTLQISAAHDSPLLSVNRNTRQALAVTATSVVVLTLALLFLSRTLRAYRDLVITRSELVSSVTHALNTPLASIRAAAATLVSGRIADHQGVRDYGHMIVEQSLHLTRLIDNLLAHARVTDVTEVYSREPLSLGELIDEVLHNFAVQLTAADFELDLNVPTDLPPVFADTMAMRLVLSNLIDNAIKYSASTRLIHISARQHDSRILFTIRDHGVGIPADEIARVTERFFRGRHRATGGSGLGLAIVQRIVADHRGRLTIQSSVGVGTTVSIDLAVGPS